MADDAAQYGRSFADVYDRWYGNIDPVPAVVHGVRRISRGWRLLELGAGTGRLARPLSEAGFVVTALDASPVMLSQIRPPARGSLHPVLADMTRLPLQGDTIDLALIAYNTLFSLASSVAQGQAIAEAARVLAIDGALVVDAIVPVPPPSGIHHRIAPARQDTDEAVLIATRQRSDAETVIGTHLHFSSSGFRSRPWTLVPQRPDRIDAMAAAVGLSVIERWRDWSGEAYDGGGRHITVYAF